MSEGIQSVYFTPEEEMILEQAEEIIQEDQPQEAEQVQEPAAQPEIATPTEQPTQAAAEQPAANNQSGADDIAKLAQLLEIYAQKSQQPEPERAIDFDGEIDNIESQIETLREKQDAGDISPSQYNSETAKLKSQMRALNNQKVEYIAERKAEELSNRRQAEQIVNQYEAENPDVITRRGEMIEIMRSNPLAAASDPWGVHQALKLKDLTMATQQMAAENEALKAQLAEAVEAARQQGVEQGKQEIRNIASGAKVPAQVMSSGSQVSPTSKEPRPSTPEERKMDGIKRIRALYGG